MTTNRKSNANKSLGQPSHNLIKPLLRFGQALRHWWRGNRYAVEALLLGLVILAGYICMLPGL